MFSKEDLECDCVKAPTTVSGIPTTRPELDLHESDLVTDHKMQLLTEKQGDVVTLLQGCLLSTLGVSAGGMSEHFQTSGKCFHISF